MCGGVEERMKWIWARKGDGRWRSVREVREENFLSRASPKQSREEGEESSSYMKVGPPFGTHAAKWDPEGMYGAEEPAEKQEEKTALF